jgi:nucleoside-diphosphate-sugar epimerase
VEESKGITVTAEQGGKPVVLITGSSGYIGSRLTEILRADYNIVGFDLRLPEADIWKVFTIHCDLTKDGSVRRAVVDLRRQFGRRLVSVVHLAGHCDFSGRPSPLYKDLNVDGTRRLLQQLQGLEVEQFVLLSSVLVLHPSEDGHPLNEFSGIRTEWHYPISMRMAEWTVPKERQNIPAVVLRIPGVYDEDCRSVPLAWQMARIQQRNVESHLFPGDTDSGRPFLHVDDLAECLLRVIEHRGELEEFELFVIGEAEVMTYGERQDRLAELIHGIEWRTICIPKTVAKVGAWVKNKLTLGNNEDPLTKPWLIDLAGQHYPVDIVRARERLGWQPRHTLRETLAKMVARFKRHPKRWYKRNNLPVPKELEGT